MNNNEEENQRDEADSAAEASLDEKLTGEATETTDDTEGTADNPLVEKEPSADQADDFSAAQEDDDTDDIVESGTDWLVDTGLAAAINPQSDIPEETSEEGDGEVDEEIQSEVTETSDDSEVDYESMTVSELKELLKEAGKPVSGKKADLISRLQE